MPPKPTHTEKLKFIMLKNILLEIEYDGSDFCGWQVQNRSKKPKRTAQEEFQKILDKVFGMSVGIDYSSRTDKGVHAKAQCVNFKVDTKIPIKNIKFALNNSLPPDIRVKKIKIVPLEFHARFDVISKIYRYIICTKKEPSVFLHNYAWNFSGELDLNIMERCVKRLIGRKDFFVFARDASKYKTCIRDIKLISIKRKGPYVHIDIEADGFLRNMARNLVSFLVSVGKGDISLKDVNLIVSKHIPYIKRPLPGRGLYLMKVKYEKQ